MSQIEFRAATTGAVDFEDRTIEVVVTPYGEEIQIEYRGKPLREVFERGAWRDIDPSKSKVSVNRDHSFERTVGKVIGLRESADGAIAMAKISKTPLGDETLRLADDGILGGSVAFGAQHGIGMEVRNGLRRVFRVSIFDHLAFLPNQAYKGSTVLGVRRSAEVEDVEMPNLESVLAIAGMSDLIRGQSNAPWRGREYQNG